jgi:hypothetical protein
MQKSGDIEKGEGGDTMTKDEKAIKEKKISLIPWGGWMDRNEGVGGS